MKIVCDSCSTKYSISDDKVRGKVFKIRCKKCSHIIVVKGTSDEGETVGEAPSEAAWHIVIDGEQVGPLGEADIRSRLSRGEVSAENYVWKEGFADWQRLADVPDFADLAPATAAGELYSEGIGSGAVDVDSVTQQAPNPFAASAGLFGVAPRDAGLSASAPLGAGSGPSAGAPRIYEGDPESPDAFGPSSHPAGGVDESADLFGVATQHAAPVESARVRVPRTNGATSGRHDGGRIESLTAQRSDNSVLFSLSNLQSLAAPGAAIRPPPSTTTTTEGSGLIDIRAMAASTVRSTASARTSGSSGGGNFGIGSSSMGRGGAEDDLPAFAAFSTAAPVLLPLPSSSGAPKWVYALIVVGVAMAIGIFATAYGILRKPVTAEQVMAPPPAPVTQPIPGAGSKPAGAPASEARASLEGKSEGNGIAPDKAADNGSGSKPIAEADLPPRKAPDGSGTDKVAAKGKHSGKGRKGGVAAPDAKAGVAASAAVATAEPEKPKAAKGSLDDLLEGALKPRGRAKVEDDAPRKSSTPGGADSAGAGPLSKGAVVAGMNAVKAKVNDCYTQFKVPGMAMVNVNIGKNGKVASSSVTGKFAGTPTGACVEKAVKTASFPPSDGLSTPYPFNLR